MIPVSAAVRRASAQRRLPRFLFDYIDGGAFGETTLARNINDLERVVLRQQVMRDMSVTDLSTSLLGETFKLPVGLGPVGLAGLCARRGETQALRAAEQAGAPFCLSTASLCSVEETARAATRPFWFQLYMAKDRAFVADMLARARDAGCTSLVLTVDMAAPGVRYRSGKAGLATPGIRGAIARAGQAAMRPHWAWDVGLRGGPLTLGNIAPAVGSGADLGDYMAWMKRNFDPAVTWKDLDFIRNHWNGPLILKGILDVEDAKEAAKRGADGILVSNHGGRQLDGASSTTRALPAIADAVSEQIAVLVDGGVRCGLDVVRMLALGAHGVLLGRAWVYALASGGGRGVSEALAAFETEMRTALTLMGLRSVDEVRARGLDALT